MVELKRISISVSHQVPQELENIGIEFLSELYVTNNVVSQEI